MKRAFFVGLILLFLCGIASATSIKDISVNILHKGEILKEISGEVWLPFDQEYSIRLQNYANVRAVAKIFIDGIKVSNMGEIVIPSSGKIDLERFLDHSLTEGKRFKFVPITHSEVQDKGSLENGKIRIEIQKEKKAKVIEILPLPKIEYDCPCPDRNPCSRWFPNTFTMSDSSVNFSNIITTSSSMGATIGGSSSNQRFTQISLDLEDAITILEFRLRGY